METQLKEAIHKVFLDQCRNRKTVTEDGHWLWSGSLNRKGYGKTTITINHKSYFFQVSRLILILEGKLDETSSLLALHKISCRVKNCFNPEHLYVGTAFDNVVDSIESGTHHETNKAHCPQGHEYTKDNTYVYGRGRTCKTCTNTRAMKRYNENKIKDQNEE